MEKFFEFLQGAAPIVASCVAIYGIFSWRKEFVGRRRIELAEETLALFYEARDVINLIRSPFGFEDGKSRPPIEGETEEEAKIRNQTYIQIQRYNENREVFNKLQSLRYRFMATFGKEHSQIFDEINKIINEIFVACQLLQINRIDELNGRVRDLENNWRRIADNEKIVWAGISDDDPIFLRLNEAVRKIEKQCETVIKK